MQEVAAAGAIIFLVGVLFFETIFVDNMWSKHDAKQAEKKASRKR